MQRPHHHGLRAVGLAAGAGLALSLVPIGAATAAPVTKS